MEDFLDGRGRVWAVVDEADVARREEREAVNAREEGFVVVVDPGLLRGVDLAG